MANILSLGIVKEVEIDRVGGNWADRPAREIPRRVAHVLKKWVDFIREIDGTRLIIDSYIRHCLYK
jgi:hypothetical protein